MMAAVVDCGHFCFAMFEDEKIAPSESSITIGRVAYCVILLLPTHNFLYLLTLPRFGAELGEGGMLLSIATLFFSVVLSTIGIVVILRRTSRQKPNGFWIVVTGIALVPLATFLLVAVYVNILRPAI
jgi:hypothetical protein